MNTLQATLKIQNAYRIHLLFKNNVYKYCYRCEKMIFCKKRNWIALCNPCSVEIDEIEKENRNWRRGKGPTPKEITHYCNNYFCDGDCGELICGCIDICRGRCGTPRHHRYY